VRLRLAALVLLAALLAAAPAQAAKRQVPRGWLGVVADGPVMEGMPVDSEWDLLASSGAESVRIGFHWPAIQPDEATPPNLATTDAIVLAAARRGVRLLPVVQGTPAWAARNPAKGVASPPRSAREFTAFLRVLIARYGTRGTLWSEHPEVRALPIRDWQIWNEPNFRDFWSQQPFAKSFVPLMRASYRTVHKADPHARAILAGMANRSWTGLDRFYKAGGRGTFDAVALHPFTQKPKNVVKVLRLARDVMRRHHDARTPVWVTELSFPAAKGKVDKPYGFETTQAGQVKALRASLRSLAAHRRKLRIERVFWYAWLTEESRGNSFGWSGLRRVRNGAIVSSSALSAFQGVARTLEGCAKPLGDAAHCR
jgi:polysaccharide biosynthesis protein PslG